MTHKETPHLLRTRAEISLEALSHNYHYLRSLAPHSKFLGLCKADAYGHSARLIAPALAELGADMLAVGTVDEGIALRQGQINSDILVLGASAKRDYSAYLQYGLTPSLHSLAEAELLAEAVAEGMAPYPCHLKVDTGMGRVGFQSTTEMVRALSLPQLDVQGIYTHFPCADMPEFHQETKRQWQTFQTMRQALPKENLLCHTANSAATLFHPETHGDMIRPGIALYGYDPSGAENPNLKPVLRLVSHISFLRPLEKGTAIGYGSSHVLEQDSLIAVLPVGYGDGYPRFLSNGGQVLICGTGCPIVGRVCMDMTMVDVTGVAGQVQVFDQAVLYGQDNLLEEAATRGGTISYELLCQLTARVPRVLVDSLPKK